jgi:hypothetical protein
MDITMAKRIMTKKIKSTKHYTKYIKIKQHEPHLKLRVNSGAPEG